MKTLKNEPFPDTHHDPYSTTLFGFWIYLLTDFMMFATFFATYAVLRNGTAGGPSANELFDLPFTLIQTLLLLISAFTSGLGKVAAHRHLKSWTLIFYGLTFFIGAAFLAMELSELTQLALNGNGWDKSAFLSAFFTLVGTHSLHMIFGLLWIIVLLIPVLKEGLGSVSLRRLSCLTLFWQFLNIVWLFIFSIVYLIGGN